MILLAISFVLIFGIVFHFRKRSQQVIVISTSVEAVRILKSVDYSRHRPNAWLIATLSIVNPFTIDSPSLLDEFKRKVIKVRVTQKRSTSRIFFYYTSFDRAHRADQENSLPFTFSSIFGREMLKIRAWSKKCDFSLFKENTGVSPSHIDASRFERCFSDAACSKEYVYAL